MKFRKVADYVNSNAGNNEVGVAHFNSVAMSESMSNDRTKALLYNIITYLESTHELSIFDSDLADEIGITREEYEEIMNI